MAIEDKDRNLLEKLLNMLGSPNEGEIGNAGRMIQKMATRYNITPAALCLGNQQPQRDAHGYGQQRSKSYDPFEDIFGRNGFHANGRSWAEQAEQKHRADQAAERQRAQDRRNADYHAEREEELRQEGKRRAREQAKKGVRNRRDFTGNYFGLLKRLKALYEEQFFVLANWQLDFIEIVLGNCKADRMMTRTQLNMAKALLKQNEEAEPLV